MNYKKEIRKIFGTKKSLVQKTSLVKQRVNSGEYKLMGLAPYGEPKYTSSPAKSDSVLYRDRPTTPYLRPVMAGLAWARMREPLSQAQPLRFPIARSTRDLETGLAG